jgi:hypothetical protein
MATIGDRGSSLLMANNRHMIPLPCYIFVTFWPGLLQKCLCFLQFATGYPGFCNIEAIEDNRSPHVPEMPGCGFPQREAGASGVRIQIGRFGNRLRKRAIAGRVVAQVLEKPGAQGVLLIKGVMGAVKAEQSVSEAALAGVVLEER